MPEFPIVSPNAPAQRYPASSISIAPTDPGGGRSLDEIARWGSMSGEERKKIMGELKGRLVRKNASGP
ncbi:MAG: DUF1289 domain-containing protein [Rhizomicrobium sp.]